MAKGSIEWEKMGNLLIVLIVIAVIVGGLVYYGIIKPTMSVKAQYMLVQLKNCKAMGEKLINDGIQFAHGEDNFPYACAPCVGGNNNNDEDADGMPDDCDKNDKNPKDLECTYKAPNPSGDGRCCKDASFNVWCAKPATT